jgi:SAM-dependent methyltransferase
MRSPDGGYADWLRQALRPFPSDALLRCAIGGDFEAMGAVQCAILKHYGLRSDSRLIDVGCGPGRLAHALQPGFRGPYLGTDAIPAFLRAARRAVRAPNFRFVRVRGVTIPAPDASADMVSFFSVITHLLHEDSYLYLEEAARVLAPGGRIVLSFLEFASPSQWDAFRATVEHARVGLPRTLNVFVERGAIAVWADHLNLRIVDVRDGAEPFAPLAEPVHFASGGMQSELGHLGQSVAVLEKRV